MVNFGNVRAVILLKVHIIDFFCAAGTTGVVVQAAVHHLRAMKGFRLISEHDGKSR